MYYNGQVVYDLDAQAPVQVGDPDGGTWAGHQGMRTTHFITSARFYSERYERTVEISEPLMREGRIMPAPVAYTHCTKCMNWKSNHHKDGSCYTAADRERWLAALKEK